MNGDYVVASGKKFDVPFNSDFASKGHEYFDVWAPEIATHYGEVFWTDQGNLPIPDAIVKRFAGKTMAITGYEQDQVMVIPTGQPGVNPDKDVSVPINWAYNHHYMAFMTGLTPNSRKCTLTQVIRWHTAQLPRTLLLTSQALPFARTLRFRLDKCSLRVMVESPVSPSMATRMGSRS